MWLDKSVQSSCGRNISQKICKTVFSSKKLPAKAILKVFPAEGEFVENFPRRKTFDIILFPQQAAAVLLRKLLNNSSLQALTGSGGKGNIGIYWHRSQNALEMFLVSAPQEI